MLLLYAFVLCAIWFLRRDINCIKLSFVTICRSEERLLEDNLCLVSPGELEESLRPPVAEIFGAAHTTVMRFSARIYQASC